jgi:hypothetical protein
VFEVTSNDFNAYYDLSSHTIVTVGFENLPLNWQRQILAHEVGHCLQNQESRFGELYARGPYEVEWDADAFAIKAVADRWGLDGAAINDEMWATLYQQFDWEGRESGPHGLSTGRQTRGELNRWISPTEGV